jgi:hypothetical protein
MGLLISINPYKVQLDMSLNADGNTKRMHPRASRFASDVIIYASEFGSTRRTLFNVPAPSTAPSVLSYCSQTSHMSDTVLPHVDPTLHLRFRHPGCYWDPA